jgi:uncharacterized protein
MKRCWPVALFVVICAVIATIAGSDCLAAPNAALLKSKARQYYRGQGVKQDYAQALRLYMQAAKMGDPEAQYIAGGMYFKGQGTTTDFQHAFMLLYEAAKNGKSTSESQNLLAKAFLIGSAVPKNYPEAVKWYTLAARKGDKDAQNELGFLYFVGKGVEQDFPKAFNLFLQAAQNGLAIAQYNLGIMLYTGNGVPQTDLPQAYAWLNLAAAGGIAAADSARQFLETALTPQQLAEAQEKSRALYESISAASAKTD